MKTQILTAVAIITVASCSKEMSTDQVAATFAAASITRVADNAWESTDKIGISMTKNGTTTLTDSNYENIPYTVDATNLTAGIFSADNEVIYLPVDGSKVDFYAYYPQTTLSDDNTISVDVSTQIFKNIDIIAATVSGASKTSPTVTFTGDNSFTHQLSKLTLNILAGDETTSLTGLKATIKGQYTTATYDIYTNEIIADETGDITAVTESDGSISEAILIPTSAIANSTIEFAIGSNTYYLDISAFVFEQGKEHTYTITLKNTGVTISGSTITNWGTGTVQNDGELEANNTL